MITGRYIRSAIRSLGHDPGFTAIAILTLALGIGANAAIFSVINAVLLEPLPYKDFDRLMVITEKDAKRNQVQPYSLSYVNFRDWNTTQRSFAELALFRAPVLYKVAGRDRALISVRMVSENFLSMLGTAPIIGRSFTPEDDRAGATPSMVLSYSGWQKLFGMQLSGRGSTAYSTTLLGEKLQFNGSTYTVIGVLPRDFKFYTADSNRNADAYILISLAREPWMTERARRGGVSALGRLQPGVTRDAARAEMDGIAAQLEGFYPVANERRGIAVDSIFDSIIDEKLRSTLYLLTAAAALVLVIGCANVANLLLARGTFRQKEIAIRVAIGGRWPVVAEFLMESVVLALAGGAAGVLVAIAGTDLLVVTAPVGLPRVDTVGLDWRVLLYSIAISIASGIAFGTFSTVQALRCNVQSELKEGGSSSVSNRHMTQKILVAGEVAVALVLLLSAGLVLRSTQKALSTDPGFDPQQLWNFGVVISPDDYSNASAIRSFFSQLRSLLANSREIQGASIVMGGIPKPAAADQEYLRLMGIRLIDGRFFDPRDARTSPPVIVIDEMLARARFRGENPIGKSFVIDLPGVQAIGLDQAREVIGVVSHIQRLGIETEEDIVVQSQFYLPVDQLDDTFFEAGLPRLLIRSTLAEDKLQKHIDNLVHSINPNVEISGLVKMQDGIERALVPRRFVTKLLTLFALLAFGLSATGIFASMSYSVSQRTQEIGVRTALGAQPAHIINRFLKEAAMVTGTGIVLGLVVSSWANQFIQYLLFDVSAVDPLTYVAAVFILLGVALLAAYIPTRGAARLEPMMALRGAGLHKSTEMKSAPSNAACLTTENRGGEMPIEVLNLQKTYTTLRGRKSPALSGVSFGVEPGTIFGLIGQNGAGKTTLVKILLGLSRPTAGSARILGCSPGSPIANRRVGYLPEHMKIPDHFLPENFLRYMGQLSGIESTTLKVRIPELLEMVGLGGIRKPVKTFSKGMQQRLGIAQALINDPEVLFLDEPTDGLDPLGRIFVRDLLVQLRQSGKTVFLNSHLLSEVELVCDRIVILNKGVVACTTTPGEFTRGTGEYVMRIDTEDEAVVERAAAIAVAMVGSTTRADRALHFRPRDTHQLNDLVDALRNIRVPILSLEPIRLSLEQFFIQVVTERKS